MPERLLLRLPSVGDPTWLRLGADGRVLEGTARGMPPASALAQASEIVVLVPAEDVLLTEAQIATRNRSQLLKAVPFAIEDQLLAPVEDLHFAAAEPVDGSVGIAVVAKAAMRAWLERLNAARIQADTLLPESLALPAGTDRASVLIDDDRAVVRFAPWSAFACAAAELGAWLERANGAAPARPLDVHDFRNAATSRASASANHPRDALAFLAHSLGKPPLNLLHGEFAPQHRAERGAKLWRIAAALAAAVLVLAVANLGLEVLQLSRTSARMQALAADAARKAFPDVGAAELARYSPADLVRTRIERLRGGADSSGLLRVLSAVGPVLASTTRIQTRGMEFRNGALELGLRAPDVATLDSVRERLATVPGLKVAVTAANPGDGGIDGRIRIGSEAGGGTR